MSTEPTAAEQPGLLDWEAAQTFLAVAESGSFSAAAVQLGLGQPAVSRRIASLEARLGIALFARGRSGATLTASAEPLLPAAREMARWAGEFQRAGAGYEQRLSGVVRVAAPPGVAVDYLPQLAERCQSRHPGLRLEVLSAVDYVNLARGEADLAIRAQVSREPELAVLFEAQQRVAVYAAPSYAATLNPPCDWQDLAWVTWSEQRRAVPPRPMLEKVVPDFRPAFSADDYLVQRSAVLAGLGAMIMGAPLGNVSVPAMDSGAQGLIEVPMKVQLPAATFALVCAKSARYVPRVAAAARLMIEAMTDAGLRAPGG